MTVMSLGFTVPEYDPLPDAVQLEKLNPGSGMPVIVTVAPALCQPVGGVTVPPGLAFIVTRYWFPKVAVYVLAEVGATVCERAPVSLQAVHRYLSPVRALAWMLSVAMVCVEPVTQLNDCGLV